MNRFSQAVNWINSSIGKIMGWLMFILVVLVTLDVVSRYLFNFGHPVVQESEWWMYSMIFLMCAGYTFIYDEHVRVDIIYSRLNRRWQNIVDLTCAFIFLFPMCTLLIWTSMWYIRNSWLEGEFSADPGGLCCYYVLKAFIPMGFFFLFLQGVVNVSQKIQELQGGDPVALPEDSFVSRAERVSGMDTP